MIEETAQYSCGSSHTIRNVQNKCDHEQRHCKGCGCYRVLRPQERYSADEKDPILSAYREWMSLRGLRQVFGGWRGTVLRWLEELVDQLLRLPETLVPPEVYHTRPVFTDEFNAYALIIPTAQHHLLTQGCWIDQSPGTLVQHSPPVARSFHSKNAHLLYRRPLP